MKTNEAALAAAIDPCAWDISISWEDGLVDGVSVRRTDGLPFEHPVWAIADHVHATLAVRGLDVPRWGGALLTREGTVCVILD